MQFTALSELGVEAYGVILNKSTAVCKVVCSSQTTEDFIAAEEDRREGVDHNFFKYVWFVSVTTYNNCTPLSILGASYMEKSKRKTKRDCTYDETLSKVHLDWTKKYSKCI